MTDDKRPGLPEPAIPRSRDELYEFEWPDDAKEQREAEREKVAAAAAVTPAPRLLALAVLGIGTAMLMILPVTLAAGAMGFFVILGMPLVLIGLFVGVPTGLIVERVTRPMPRGVPLLTLIVLGGALGFGLTYGFVTLYQELLLEDTSFLNLVRSQASLLMMTVTASSFAVAHLFADRVRAYPKQLWLMASLIALTFVMSVYLNFA